MKSTRSLGLVMCLLASSARVAAAQSTGPQPDPIDRSDWSVVRKVKPGTALTIALKGDDVVRRSFIAADDIHLLVLDVANLPSSTRDELIEIASSYPEDYRNGPTIQRNRVRIGPDGVFADNHKVAEIGAVVREVERGDVGEIAVPVMHDRRAGIGEGVGAAVGFVLGIFWGLGSAATGGKVDPFVAVIGSTIAGGLIGHIALKGDTETVIYHAP